MYSLIKYVITYHCNDDISNLIFRLYLKIIFNLTYLDASYNHYCINRNHIDRFTYSLKRIRTYSDTKDRIGVHICCIKCNKFIRSTTNSRCLLYMVNVHYKNEFTGFEWKYSNYRHDEHRYHLDCFKERFGVIYDF